MLKCRVSRCCFGNFNFQIRFKALWWFIVDSLEKCGIYSLYFNFQSMSRTCFQGFRGQWCLKAMSKREGWTNLVNWVLKKLPKSARHHFKNLFWTLMNLWKWKISRISQKTHLKCLSFLECKKIYPKNTLKHLCHPTVSIFLWYSCLGNS